MKRTAKTPSRNPRRNPESGYTVLIALLLVATILLITAAAAPNIYTEGRRERDAEMIWRGQQYVRAIGLYYKKYGHYPHTIDDLTKSDNQIRFLRQAYKDPMNTDDGSWRLIYVGPGGVLINSVMYTNIAQVGLQGGGNAGAGAAAGTGGGNGVTGAASAESATPSGAQSSPDATHNPDSDSQSQPLQGDVIGGNLVGVGSKVKKPSIKVYKGGTTYYQWEFIWNPLQGQQAGSTTASPSTPYPLGGGAGGGLGSATGGGTSTPVSPTPPDSQTEPSPQQNP